MYATLFGITQDPYVNTYIVPKLVTLGLGCTFVPLARNITVPFTLAALLTLRTAIENHESLKNKSWRGYL